MYSSHSVYSMAGPINCQPFYSKDYSSARNENGSNVQTLSNYCCHGGDDILPGCNVCQANEADQETVSKYLTERPIPVSYGKNQHQDGRNQSQESSLSSFSVDKMTICNGNVLDKTVPGTSMGKSLASNSSHNTNLFGCDLCRKIFTQESQLLDHKHSHHPHDHLPDQSNDETETKLASSQFDGNICSNSILYKRKQQNFPHVSLKPFVCSMCPKVFAQRTNLKNHERTHTGARPFECDVCHRAFSQRGNLNTHRRTHGGEKGFVCEVCFKSFSQKGNLKNHTRSHTGERPFHCRECGKTFRQRTDLRNHERVHSGEKPFVCSVCSKAFSQRANLKIHGRTHSGEKPFGCSICGKMFTQKGNLKCHVRTHYSDKTTAVLS